MGSCRRRRPSSCRRSSVGSADLTLARRVQVPFGGQRLEQRAGAGDRVFGRGVADRRDAVVIIKADKEVLHGLVVEVMDIAKSAGATRLAIVTEPKAPESRGGVP